MSRARAAGAGITALVNAQGSPLAPLADDLIPLHAGPERSVAATKSAAELIAQGADVLLAGDVAGATALPTIAAHPVIEPLLLAQSFYRMANALSLARDRNPDQPPHLCKVTETL